MANPSRHTNLIPNHFEDWQIPCTFQGTFSVAVNVGPLHERKFKAHVVNADKENTEFFVRLFVEGSQSQGWETSVSVEIRHGSGKSADYLAVEKALDEWNGRPVITVIFEEEDEDSDA